MLRNTLAQWIDENELAALSIEPTWRGERLSVADYVRIANAVRTLRPPRSSSSLLFLGLGSAGIEAEGQVNRAETDDAGGEGDDSPSHAQGWPISA